MNIDEITLNQSIEIIKLINSSNPGDDVQLQAKIQRYLIEKLEQRTPVYWELWCHDETSEGHWFLVEKSHNKLLARKNQVSIPFYTNNQYPPTGLPK